MVAEQRRPLPARVRTLNLEPWQAAAARAGWLTQIRLPLRYQPHESQHEPGVYLYCIGVCKWAMNQRRTEVFKRRPTGDELQSAETRTVPLAEWLPRFAPWRPGDVIRGKERWAQSGCGCCDPIRVHYEADGRHRRPERMRPANTMPPRWLRFAFRVIAVRAERVAELTAHDALACGVKPPLLTLDDPRLAEAAAMRGGFDAGHCQLAINTFRDHWCRRWPNAWSLNHWVAIADVEKCEVPHAE